MNDELIDLTIQNAVAEAIQIAGSQKALADLSGLTQGAVGKYYRGLSRPKGETAIRLEKAVERRIHRSRFAPHIFYEEA